MSKPTNQTSKVTRRNCDCFLLSGQLNFLVVILKSQSKESEQRSDDRERIVSGCEGGVLQSCRTLRQTAGDAPGYCRQPCMLGNSLSNSSVHLAHLAFSLASLSWH